MAVTPATKTGPRAGWTFTNEETLGLAKTWTNQSHLGPSQSESSLWEKIAEYCDLELNMEQNKLGSLHVKWQILHREGQIYLAARKASFNIPSSGRTALGMEEPAIKLYRFHAGKKGIEGNYVFSTQFLYVEAALFLKNHPKFGGQSSDDERKMV